jgi:hypothetical protein
MHDSVIVECRFDLFLSPRSQARATASVALAWPFEKRALHTVMSYLHIACLFLMAMIYSDDDGILMMTYWFAWEHIL